MSQISLDTSPCCDRLHIPHPYERHTPPRCESFHLGRSYCLLMHLQNCKVDVSRTINPYWYNYISGKKKEKEKRSTFPIKMDSSYCSQPMTSPSVGMIINATNPKPLTFYHTRGIVLEIVTWSTTKGGRALGCVVGVE